MKDLFCECRLYVQKRSPILAVLVLIATVLCAFKADGQVTHHINGNLEDQYGSVVDVSGNTAIVGSPGGTIFFSTVQGYADIVKYTGNNFVLQQRLFPTDTFHWQCNEDFGDNVAIDGNTAIVSALNSTSQSICPPHMLYVFQFNGSYWDQTQILFPFPTSNPFEGAIDVSGDRVVVGTAHANAGPVWNAGAALVYKFNGTTWVQEQLLVASDAASSDLFGHDVSISGSKILVGAPFDDYAGKTNAGSAYVFSFNGVNWVEEQKLVPSGPSSATEFGNSVSLDADQCLIGNVKSNNNGIASGAAYIFDFDGTSWVQIKKLLANDGNPGDHFGNSVSIENDIAVIGAYRDDDYAADAGSAYLFRNLGGTWTEVDELYEEELNPWTPSIQTGFGWTVAASENTVAIGSPGYNYGDGAAYFIQYNVPANDSCASATMIGCGIPVDGSTVYAGKADAPNACGTALNTASGVWYTYLGTGDTVTASLCGDGYDTKIGIFTGICGGLTCVTGNDDYCGTQSQVTFKSIPNVLYYIYVSGYQQSEGHFSLSLDCIPSAPPSNDLCFDALPISCGSKVLETTALSGNADAPISCSTSVDAAPGLWYVLAGTGDSVTLSLCNSYYDTKVLVYSGNCTSYTCVAGNDDDCGLNSQVRFPTIQGTDYLIYVTGYNNSSGVFEMEVSCGQANDLCLNAASIECGDTATGSTINSLPHLGLPVCNSHDLGTGPGVWYRFTGTGDTVTASTCGSAFDTRLGVFSNTCNSLICVSANDDDCGLQSNVTFSAHYGVTYYIYVTGYQALSGDYQLILNCANQVCYAATVASSDNITTNSVVLHWDSVPGAMEYRIQGGALGGSVITIDVPAFPTSLQVNNLASNTTFVWAVRAICNASGTQLSPYSNIDTFSTQGCSAPTSLNTTSLTSSSVTLNWATVPGATGYAIFGQKVGVSPDIAITITGGSASFFNVVNLAANTSYSWTIRANCGGASSVAAQRDTFTTMPVAKYSDVEEQVSSTGLSKNIRIYPNPATDRIIIEFSHLVGCAQCDAFYTLYDIKASVVMQGTQEIIQGKTILGLPPGLAKGMYNLKIVYSGNQYLEKVMLLD